MSKTKPIRKAVIPVAGYATRFLPQTKAMPKHMLPLVDKPIIQYIVEDLVEAGIKDIIFVTSPQAHSIEDHFDKPSRDLVDNLKAGGPKKLKFLEEVESIAKLANFIYIRQSDRYGNGIPIYNAQHLINDEPFIYTWGDDMFKGKPNEYLQLIDKYNKYGLTRLSCLKITNENDYSKYGVVGGSRIEDGVIDMTTMIEKPGIDLARKHNLSDLSAVSSMLFSPDIFGYIEKTMSSIPASDEFYYTEALREMLKDRKKVLAVEIKNSRYMDLGNKLDYLKAVVEFGTDNVKVGEDFKAWLKDYSSKI